MKKVSAYLLLASTAISFLLMLKPAPVNTKDEKATVNTLLNNWHAAASKADFKVYFSKISEKGRYLGTDATENWDKKAFIAFSKPYFEKGKAWDFKALERNIYFSKDGKMAWFDELLNTTNMKICRGSGVLEKEGKDWKIKHYVLSMTIPNEVADDVVPIKAKSEDAIIGKLKH